MQTKTATTYKIVHKFRNGHPDEVIETGLTLEQAKAHCQNENTSSGTAWAESAKAITAKLGPWFDAWYEEA